MTSQGSVLFVDAYDSFAENIAALLHEHLHVQVTLIRIDGDIHKQFKQSNQEYFSSFDAIVLGPGPGNPENDRDVGLFNEVWEYAAREKIPVLGICLGFQSLCAQNGILVIRLTLPCHGHAKRIYHADRDIFCDTGSIIATCYNSLGVCVKDLSRDGMPSRPSSSGSSKSMSSSQSFRSAASDLSKPARDKHHHNQIDNLEVLAWDEDDWVMAVSHRLLPFHGFQFHPESCKSNLACQTLIKQWWNAATTHNKEHRASLSPRQAVSRNLKQVNITSISSEARNLFERLCYVSRFCKGNVKRESLHLPGASTMIASLCHQSSPEHFTAMLESTKKGRYSIYAFPHEWSFLLECIAGQVLYYVPAFDTDRRYFLGREDAVAVLESFIRSRSFKDDEIEVPFRGGFIGFMSYEFGTASLHLDIPKKDGPLASTPEISLLWADRSIVYDHQTGMAHVQSLQEDDAWVEDMIMTLQSTYASRAEISPLTENKKALEILSSVECILPNHDKYVSQIRACQSELLAGNSYELCLTTQATITTPADAEVPYFLYRNIHRHNPVPFGSFICLNKTTILSSSPEQFLSWSSKDGTIDMIPMKGTVKKTPNMNLAKATAILSSAKESAENLMIADLIRHDLYSTVGHDAKVEVVKLCDVVESETVFSLVSHIRAHIPSRIDMDNASDEHAQGMAQYGIRALAHTMPPGSMTGAPKSDPARSSTISSKEIVASTLARSAT